MTKRLQVELVATDSACERAGAIHSVDRGLLRLVTSRPYVEGEEVEVRVGGCAAPGQVAYSVPRGEHFRTAVALLRDTKLNRRADRRVPVKWRAHVWVIGDDPDVFEADVVDVSSSGFGLVAPKQIGVAERVGVETPHCIGFGEVLHCRAEAGGYRLGVHIVELLGGAFTEPSPGPLEWLRRWLGN